MKGCDLHSHGADGEQAMSLGVQRLGWQDRPLNAGKEEASGFNMQEAVTGKIQESLRVCLWDQSNIKSDL